MRVIVTAAAALLLTAAGSAAAQASPEDPASWVACVAQAQQLPSDGMPTRPPKEPVCYYTWQEYASAVTSGKVTSFRDGASPEAKLAQIDAVSRAQGAVLLARFWDYTNFGGSFLDFVAEPCADPLPAGWSWPYIGSTWDNRISSARVYANTNTRCTMTTLYSGRDFSGDYHFCVPECSSLGDMNNRTTSMIISTRPYLNGILPESA